MNSCVTPWLADTRLQDWRFRRVVPQPAASGRRSAADVGSRHLKGSTDSTRMVFGRARRVAISTAPATVQQYGSFRCTPLQGPFREARVSLFWYTLGITAIEHEYRREYSRLNNEFERLRNAKAPLAEWDIVLDAMVRELGNVKAHGAGLPDDHLHDSERP